MTNARRAHWIKLNHQERMPRRMVAFDTESDSSHDGDVETQRWKVGCAIRWRTDLSSGDKREASVFDSPLDFWTWVSEYTRAGCRTVVWAHNLGHDVRISQMFDILPVLGFRLEWCNLDRNISSATWRSDHGTIVLADTWTWIPLPLNVIAPQVGLVKYDIPAKSAPDEQWASYCMRDAEILYNVVSVLVKFISDQGLGNWQPTGAGMAYATWRHKFLTDKVLVHDDRDVLTAEREAMHTGRAEAWRHGEITGEKWTEIDLKTAYLVIASECEVPRKLHLHHGAISIGQFRDLTARFAVLCRVQVMQKEPILPMKLASRHLWPVGVFETWAWDCEVEMAIRHGAKIRILDSYAYVRGPVLGRWARWTMSILGGDGEGVHPIVRTHLKHCSRALIGRLSLRVPSWEQFGSNVEGITGITHMVIPEENRTARLLHVGEDTLIETRREEGKDSMPMITGWIMAQCRVRLYDMMKVIGEENIAHVDTDSIVANSAGIDRCRRELPDSFPLYWAVKGTWTKLTVHGPRVYYRGKERVIAGIPVKAEESSPGVFTGEKWSGLASDLEGRSASTVTVTTGTWRMRRKDPRRADAAGAGGRTRAYDVAELPSANGLSSSVMGSGE